MTSYAAFLKTHAVSKDDKSGKPITNTRIGDKGQNIYGGSYSIPDDKYNEFLDLYYKHVFVDGNPEYLTEKQLPDGVIIVDMDLRHNYSITERKYNDDHITDILFTYSEKLREIIDFKNGDKFNIYVFQKPNVNRVENKNITKDGLHIIIGLRADRKAQAALRQKIINDVPTSWCDLDITNPWEEVFDNAVTAAHCNFQMFGSKKPSNEAYQITGAWEYEYCEEMAEFETAVLDITNIEPLFKQLSVRDTTAPKFGYKSTYPIVLPPTDNNINKAVATTPTEQQNNLNLVKKCFEAGMFKSLAEKEYSAWSKMGLFMKGYFGDTQEIYDVFDIYCNLGEKKYDKLINREKWDNFKPKDDKYSFGTFVNWAKKDNKTLYDSIWNEFKTVNKKLFETDNNNSYEQVKMEFEKKNFKIMNPVLFAQETNDGYLFYSKKNDFRTKYENIIYKKFSNKFNEDGTPIYTNKCFIDDWFKDEKNRTYDKVEFLPQQTTPKGVYNTFKGFRGAQQPIIPDVDIETSPIMTHLKHLCNNDPAFIDYTIKVLARKVQEPHNITNTALIFKSEEGAGKGVFFDYLGNKILGEQYYFTTEKVDTLFGKFNSVLENKILVVIDETSGKDTFSLNENIKVAITRHTNNIERKNFDPVKENNHIQYIFTTNNDIPLKISYGERRFTGCVCNNGICNNAEYFNTLVDAMNSGRYDRAFYDYLMAIDVNKYDFTKKRPMTEFYKDAQEINTPVMALFLEEILGQSGGAPKIEEYASSLFDKFNKFVEKRKFKCEINSTRFGLDIKKYAGITKRRLTSGIEITIQTEELRAFLKCKYNIKYDDETAAEDNIVGSGICLI
jgi:Family of unknown function (DUF5906)/Primase C terminal 2 (PriCT-2)